MDHDHDTIARLNSQLAGVPIWKRARLQLLFEYTKLDAFAFPELVSMMSMIAKAKLTKLIS